MQRRDKRGLVSAQEINVSAAIEIEWDVRAWRFMH